MIWQTIDKLFFRDGSFLLFVTCNKAQGFGRLQSSLASPSLSSPFLQESSTLSSSFISSLKGRSGPISSLGRIGSAVEVFVLMLEYTWSAENKWVWIQIYKKQDNYHSLKSTSWYIMQARITVVLQINLIYNLWISNL
jgi:hypothetical protein